MRFRSDQRAPLKQGQFRTLPSINQHHLDTPTDRNDTDIFHATLRGLTAAQTAEPADEGTEQASIGDLAPHAPESSPHRQPPIFRRRMVLTVVALFVLLTIASGMVGARLGGVGADQATSIAIATPTPLPATGPQSGIVSVETPTPSATATPTPKPKPPTPTPAPQPSPPPYSTDGPYSNSTPPPGYKSFAVTEPSPDPYGAFGQCTWWAADKRPDENFSGWGAAMNWANGARARGYTVTQTPVENATVVFAPGVQGASGTSGHVSHVEQVLTDGWVLVSEMNFYWNGGGFARVNYRYIHVGAGVWFIH